MALDFDNFPTYDPIIKTGTLSLSNIWSDFLATFIQTLQGYLSQNGIFVPILSSAQRDQIKNPQNGQMIFNSDENGIETYNGTWGFFLPRLTTAERDAITSPINGQLLYNTTLNKFQGYENGAWVNLV